MSRAIFDVHAKSFWCEAKNFNVGEHSVKKLKGSTAKAEYLKHLLDDLEALQRMSDQNMFESSPIRIGAEQEFCLVNETWEPAELAVEVLKGLDGRFFTTELARYNLEANLEPLSLSGECFSKMHAHLDYLMGKARTEAAKYGLKVVLTGILPSIDSRHLKKNYMTPIERYKVLDETIREVRGDNLELHIKGVDELNLRHDSILFEGCNTSFQGHLQIDVNDFANSYNWAQAISGPILAICANSPLLMGRELWQETRIALFTQSVDMRPSTFIIDQREARVGFGKEWVTGSIVDFFKDNIVSFPSLLTTDFDSASTQYLKTGRVPKLRALNLHNGTVYKWNRVCYGVTNGKPHVRIENRYLPSGPTTADEIANLMFWVGVMRGRPKEFDNIETQQSFKDIKTNFYSAARYGMATQFYWNGELLTSKELLLDHFLPMAYKGLYKLKVAPEDVEKYLSIIERRIMGMNASRWMVLSYRKLMENAKPTDALHRLIETMYAREQKGYTVDAWQLATPSRPRSKHKRKLVRHYMSTKIITAQHHDSAALVLKMMQWKNIHHIPVMNERFDLVGLLTWSDLDELSSHKNNLGESVIEHMKTDLITTGPDVTIDEAKKAMEDHGIHCLPVVQGKKLIGILTNRDF
ncbi:CBS domain-containing protein [Pareuzebyella sediminis]|uniref:CBS domain-containing protein n=1 Tax=Pareuzebyella sediminis TaxID=2607998 RepID=UPI001E56F241|nr:CBS domain-containing protein [Pareuzebyella sediminis]